MDFDLSREQKTLQEQLTALVSSKFGPEYWEKKDGAHEFPSEFWAEMASNGYLGLGLPEEWGGVGGGMMDLCVAVESMCAAGAGLGAGFLFVNSVVFAGNFLARYGTDAQKEKYLRPLTEGSGIYALGVTEPDAGTDTLSMATRADRKPDGTYSINGKKVFTSGAERAVRIVTVARTRPRDEKKRTAGIGIFLVDPKSRGITIDPLAKLGLRYINTNQVFFNDVAVDRSDLVGDGENGWKILLDILIPERIVVAAQSLGTAQLALNIAVNYAKERKVFGRPIGSNQAIQLPLAELQCRIDAARNLTYKAAWLYDSGRPEAGPTANKAKFLACEVGFAAADRAMQTLGGYGYLREYHVERLWREVRLMQIAPITQDLSLIHIAHSELGLPRSY